MDEAKMQQLWALASKQFHAPAGSVHGPDHWRRVERNGVLLASRTGADVLVVRLFAVFHDCRRQSDCWEDGHGARGAEWAISLREACLELADAQFALLTLACRGHTDGTRHDDPTIGTCWDADRLDLGRVGVIPSADYMSTAFAREIAEYGSIQPWVDGLAER